MPIAIGPSFAAGSAPARAMGARQEARQAQNMAQRLRAQADAAQRSADREQQRADQLMQRSDDADQRSASARRVAGAAQSEVDRARLPAVQHVPPQAVTGLGTVFGAAFGDGTGYASGQFLSVMA